MTKEKTKAAAATRDLFKRPPGRPPDGERAMTGAQRIAKLRAERKAAGLCQCCGQLLPKKE